MEFALEPMKTKYGHSMLQMQQIQIIMVFSIMELLAI